MYARLVIALALISGLMAGPVALASCPPKVQKACCKCCANAAKPCGMTAKTDCNLPLPNDQATQSDSKPMTTPQVVAMGEIQFFSPAGFPAYLQKNSTQIPSPPLLALNCIRLI
jgi:hypothetical protein